MKLEVTNETKDRKMTLEQFYTENFGLRLDEDGTKIEEFKTLIEEKLNGKSATEQLQVLADCWAYVPIIDPQFEEYMQGLELQIAKEIAKDLLTEADEKIFSLLQDPENTHKICNMINNFRSTCQLQNSTQKEVNNLLKT